MTVKIVDLMLTFAAPATARRAFQIVIDDRYGPGTCEMLEADARGSQIRVELAVRFGITPIKVGQGSR